MRELHPACAFVLLCMLILLSAFSLSPAVIAFSLCGSVAFCRPKPTRFDKANKKIEKKQLDY